MTWNKAQMVGDGLAIADPPEIEQKFTPADATVDWPHINVLVHGPGAWGADRPGDTNSAVFACLMAIATAYPEPPLQVMRRRAGREYPIPDHPLQKLLEMPTPDGVLSMEDLLFWISWAKHTDGNAYLLKQRAGHETRGNVVELWPLAPNRCKPATDRDRDGQAKEWISHYRVQVSGSKFEEVPVENIIHFRLGVDPLDMRLGISPLKRLVREVATDDEATKFTDTLLKNFAIPGLVVIPSGALTVDKDAADRISETISQKFTGENRGKVAVMSRESTLQQFGFSPEQLQMDVLHRIPEERIAAVMGVPAIVAGLGAGLDRSTFANFRESREMFTEQKMVPEWRQDAARINVSLKPDFAIDRNVFVIFDTTNVRALQEDMDARYLRLNTAVQGGWMLRNEARAEVGYEPVEGWDEEDKEPPAVPQFMLPAGNTNGQSANGQPAEEEEEEGEGEKRHPFATNGYRNGGRMLAEKQARRQIVNGKRRVRNRIANATAVNIDRWFRNLADRVIVAAARREPAVEGAGNGHALETKAITREEWARIVAQIFRQEAPGLEGVLETAVADVVAGTWGLFNLELGQSLQFDINDPLVQDVLETAGENIRDILDTTLDTLRPALQELYEDGQPVEAIAARVRELVEETYTNRGLAIARTEIGRSQNLAGALRYRAAGVQHVEVFDNGVENSHPFCRRVDGAVVTLEWAQRNPLQHPNCLRAFGPVFDYDGPVWAEEEPW